MTVSDRSVDGTERSGYSRMDALVDTWRANFKRVRDGRVPDESHVTTEWDRTDDEAVLRLELADDAPTHWDRPASRGKSRILQSWFDAAVDAAQETGRYVSAQDNPRDGEAMLAIPVAENMEVKR